MNQQPDKFFSDKLQGYQKPAPAGAWDRIESALEKKTTPKFSWWKIAATFLLLMGFGYAVWVNTTNTKTQQLVQKGNDQNIVPEEKSDSAKTNYLSDRATNNIASNDASPVIADRAPAKVTRKKTRGKNVDPVSDQPITQAPAKEEDATPIVEDIYEVDVRPSVESREKSTGITLTITIDEANKYLDKDALAQATSDEKKSSTFKKLLKKANDLKSNQDPFGDLREKKNEILALNFKNEKRGQNK